jgi:hypothetical protein
MPRRWPLPTSLRPRGAHGASSSLQACRILEESATSRAARDVVVWRAQGNPPCGAAQRETRRPFSPRLLPSCPCAIGELTRASATRAERRRSDTGDRDSGRRSRRAFRQGRPPAYPLRSTPTLCATPPSLPKIFSSRRPRERTGAPRPSILGGVLAANATQRDARLAVVAVDVPLTDEDVRHDAARSEVCSDVFRETVDSKDRGHGSPPFELDAQRIRERFFLRSWEAPPTPREWRAAAGVPGRVEQAGSNASGDERVDLLPAGPLHSLRH